MDADDYAEQRWLAAFHEAGHAVATVLRNGSELLNVSLGDGEHAGTGVTGHLSTPSDTAFVAYAGPWAQARCEWPGGLPIDGEDDDGCEFIIYVAVALDGQPGDADKARPVPRGLVVLPDRELDYIAAGREAVWRAELERVWPVVQRLARQLVEGVTVTDTTVRAMVAARSDDHSNPSSPRD